MDKKDGWFFALLVSTSSIAVAVGTNSQWLGIATASGLFAIGFVIDRTGRALERLIAK